MDKDIKLMPGQQPDMRMNGSVPTYVKGVPVRCELLEDTAYKMMLNTLICFGPQAEERFNGEDEHLRQRDVLIEKGLAVKIVNQIYFVQTAATEVGLQTYLNHMAYMKEEHEKVHGKPQWYGGFDVSPLKDYGYRWPLAEKETA